MADSEVLKILKDIPFKIQTASLKERRIVIGEIQNILLKPGITEAVVRFICRVLVLTLHRYHDSTSQYYVKGLLSHLCTHHRDWTLRNFLPILLDISEQLLSTATSKSVSNTGLFALKWSKILVEAVAKSKSEEGVNWDTLVLAQANLLAVVTAYGDAKKNKNAFSVVHSCWSRLSEEQLGRVARSALALPADAGPAPCVALAALHDHCRRARRALPPAAYQDRMLECLTKSLINVKTRPNAHHVEACAQAVAALPAAQVAAVLLPALHKALLRSPESAAHAVAAVLRALPALPAAHAPAALQLGQTLIANLYSTDEWVRRWSLAALRSLGGRCCGPAPLLAHAFLVYGGAPGLPKLSSSEDKIAVLNGISALSETDISSEQREAVFEEVCAQMKRVLDAESHERTLCAALDALQHWAAARRKPLHPLLADLYLKNMSSKSPTPLARISYTALVARGVRAGAADELRRRLRAPLAAAVDRALAQPLQPLVVGEGLSALLALVGGAGADAITEAPLAMRCLPLLHERTLHAAPHSVLIQVALLCSTLLENYESIANDQSSPVYKAFILVLLSPNKVVRDAAVQEVKALLAKEDRALMARYLVLKLNEVLEEGKIFTTKDKTPPEEKGSDVTGRMVVECIYALCSYNGYPRAELEELALSMLECCHAPAVAGAGAPAAWARACARLGVAPDALIDAHATALQQAYVTEYRPAQWMRSAVATLCSLGGRSLGDAALTAALEALRCPRLLRVTRDEYFTYLTPPTDLYDKSVVPGNEDSKEMNLKRESKAYSYKEQLEELQLRRELEEKRKKEGKVKEAPLTAKQKEAIKAQLAKESAIRERLTELNERVVVAVDLVEAVAEGASSLVGERARELVPGALGAMRSPLAAPRLAPALLRLGRALLPAGAPPLAAGVPRLVLRLCQPQCDLDPRWEAEDLDAATVRMLGLLHAATGPRGATFTAPGFCYVFPLLKMGLQRTATRANEAAMAQGLAVVERHAAAGLPPLLLPVDQMFRLLIDLISSTSGRVQSACTAALLETAQCAARAPLAAADAGCLLAGLQDPLEVVRDAALRALTCVAGRLPALLEEPATALPLAERLLLATYDVAPDNRKLAEELWSRVDAERWCGCEEMVELVLRDVQHPAEAVQRAAAAALHRLAAAAQPGGAHAPAALMLRLHQIYEDRLPLIPAQLDQFGHEVCGAVDEWGARRGAGAALRALAPALGGALAAPAARFFVARALHDRHDQVRAAMLDAAMALVDLHGKVSRRTQCSQKR